MKKTCLIVALCFSFMITRAQKVVNNMDSVYYYVDAASTPVKDRMWEVGTESKVKYFAIKCPCLKDNAWPNFIYRLSDQGEKIDKNQFGKINMRDLPTLIRLAKEDNNLTATTLHIYFFIEKSNDNEYIVHKTKLYIPPSRTTNSASGNISSGGTTKNK